MWAGSQTYLVVGVVNHWGFPLALVVGVINHWSFPGATTGGCLTGGVRDLRSLPLAVHVLIPEGQDVHRLNRGQPIRELEAVQTHQSSGLTALGSPMYSGSSSNQPSGLTALSSGI